jgi:hypothetical protein
MANMLERMGRRGRPDETTDSFARGLGWFSIALGLAEITAPRKLARTLGMRGYEPIILAFGVREVVKGVGILTSSDPKPWVWGRVAGDGLDILTLLAGLNERNPKRGNVLAALAAVAGVAVADIVCAQALSQESAARRQPIRNYSTRSGLPHPAQEMRGAARDFEAPPDFRTPEALRPWM